MAHIIAEFMRASNDSQISYRKKSFNNFKYNEKCKIFLCDSSSGPLDIVTLGLIGLNFQNKFYERKTYNFFLFKLREINKLVYF